MSRAEDIEYFGDTFKAFQLFEQLGYELFIVTNQSGVGRGYFSMEQVHVIHRQLQNDLRENKLSPIKDFAICPHQPDDKCDCRKPSGKMIRELIVKYKIDPAHSYMAGDKLVDAQSGKDAGVTGILVRNNEKSEFATFKTLLDFAQSLKK